MTSTPRTFAGRTVCFFAAWRFPGVTPLVTAAALGFAVLPEPFRAACLLRPGDPGFDLRWLTGHLVHVSASHLFWDVAVFVGLGLVLERRCGSVRFAAVLLAAALGVSLGVVLLRPDLGFYAGLSGIDSALAGGLAVGWLLERGPRRVFGGLLLLGLLAKSGYEWCVGQTAFAELAAGVVPVPSAHLAGAVVGAVAGLFLEATGPHPERYGGSATLAGWSPRLRRWPRPENKPRHSSRFSATSCFRLRS